MAIEFLNGIDLAGTLELKTLSTNTSSTTALVMSGDEVQKRTLGSAAFVDTTDFLTSSSTQAKYLRSDISDSGTGTLTLGDTGAADSPLILGSSSQTSYTLQQFQTSSHGTNNAYFIAYGDGHGSQAGNFAMKNTVSDGEIFFELASSVEPLRMTSTGSTFAGTVLIDGVSNYTGLEVKGVGGSRPEIKWSNANNGNLGNIYGTETNSLVIATGSSGATALTLDASQNATFAGDVILDSDSTKLKLGADQDAELYHNGSHLFIDNSKGTSYFRNTASDGSGILLRNSTIGDIQFDNEFAGNILFNTSNVTRLTIDSDGDATFAGDVSASEILFTTLNGHAHIDSQSSSLMIEASNIQAMGNLIPDGNGNRPLGASNRYWSHLYANTISTGAITSLAKGGEFGSTGYYVNSTFKDVADNCGVILGHNDTANGVGVIAGINELAFLTYGTAWTQALLLDTNQKATFAGQIKVPDGSASTPSYSFSGRTDTGMYARAHSSNDRLSFTTDGSERFYIDSNGTTSVGNSYVGENNSFRNYAGDWAGTTVTANKGFYFNQWNMMANC